jgi:hypothetical protein
MTVVAGKIKRGLVNGATQRMDLGSVQRAGGTLEIRVSPL